MGVVGRPRESKPVLLRTLVLRRGLLRATSASSLCFFRRHKKHAPSSRRATPNKEPITAPAIAPPDKALRREVVRSSELLAAVASDGVDVTVCVTLPPETVTMRMLVTGVGVADDVGRLLDTSVVAATGTTAAAVVLLELDADEVDVACAEEEEILEEEDVCQRTIVSFCGPSVVSSKSFADK